MIGFKIVKYLVQYLNHMVWSIFLIAPLQSFVKKLRYLHENIKLIIIKIVVVYSQEKHFYI